MRKNVLILLLSGWFLPASACPPVSYLGIEQGLSNNAVRVIFQDHQGFMWFGTYDGLNRYDGYGFKVFRNTFADTNSLVNNWINALGEDGTGRLWVGTRQGLNVYDGRTGVFSAVYYKAQTGAHDAQAQTGLVKSRGDVRYIQNDGDGGMLIATETEGLLYVDPRTGATVQVPFIHDGKADGHYHVSALQVLPGGRALLYAQNQGLCMWDRRSGKVTLLNREVQRISCFDYTGDKVWVGTAKGVLTYHIATNAYTAEAAVELTSEKITALMTDEHGNLWIATNGDGIAVYSPGSGKLDRIRAGNGSLSSSAVYCLYKDRQDRKWVGTLRGGINVMDPGRERFRTIARSPAGGNTLVNDFIFSFYETPGGHLWIGTDGGGLSIWDRATDHFVNYTHRPGDRRSLSDNFIMGIKADKEGNTWISTYFGGVDRCRGEGGVFEHYTFDTSGRPMTYALFVDRSDHVWAGTLTNGGLYLFDRARNRFVLFDAGLTDIFAMAEDREGTLWAGNLTQLVRIDRLTKRHVFTDIGQPIRSIVEDTAGNLWLGTEGGGLVQFDKQHYRVIRRYTTADGLCNNAVLGILPDKAGNLWMSTFNGLSKFNIGAKTFSNYEYSDGLQSNQFNYNAAIALRSGALAFGGIKGFTLFDPGKIKPVDNAPPLALTGILVNNKEAGITELRVPFDQAVFTFDYTALEYSAPDKIAYAYYMEGWDKGWNYAGNTRKAVYTRLDEGTYLFKVKCTNTEGRWNGKELTLRVIVLPPWYRTWWAYLLYTVLAGAVVSVVVVFKARQVKLKKERIARERTLAFFTNMSHEFRTPLTLIINPLKERAETNEDLKVAYRNARRMISLVDQLLLLEKAESGTDVLRAEPLDLSDLCREVYLCFVHQARTRKIEYLFEAPDGALPIYGDRDKLDIVLYNLFSNAVKYTPPGGRIECRIKALATHIECSISDSGRGIDPEVGNKIFERFYRQGDAKETGFGIGLYLARQFCVAHKGDITYTSEVGKGTVFTVTLPKSEVTTRPAPLSSTLLEEISGEPFEETEPPQPGTTDLEDLHADNLISEKKTILVIDDDPQMCRYLVSLFQEAYKVRIAGGGEEGLALARKYLPDIMISDVKMEGMDGIALCRKIKEDPVTGHIPVILLTASVASKLKGVEGGADDYMIKPFDAALLQARVKSILNNQTVLQRYFHNEITLRQNDLKISGEYKAFIEKCIEVVEAHLDEEDFGVQAFIRDMGMSRSSLFRKVKSVSGLSIILFIRFIRLRKAAQLFINENYNVNETAAMVGIYDLKYFRKQFHKLFGLNPSEYITRYRKVFNGKYAVDKDRFDPQQR